MDWKVSQVKCVHCWHVYTCVRPLECFDEELECPECHKLGAAVCSHRTNAFKALKGLWF